MSSSMQQVIEDEINADPRVNLAVERTELALERTHLAWIRTLFTIMTAGFAIDKGLEFIHEKRLLSNQALIQNGHFIGIFITTVGLILMGVETFQYIKRSRQLAAMRNGKFNLFSTTVLMSGMMLLLGTGLVYFMLATG